MTGERPTHREVCRAVAAHLLGEPWVDACCWEVGVGEHQVDVLAVSASLSATKDAAAVERWRARVEHARVAGRAAPAGPRRVTPRVAVVEVKVSRQDLLAGIRRGQLGAYSGSTALLGTHYSLALWDEALSGHRSSGIDRAAALVALTTDGVPAEWGIIRVSGRPRRLAVEVLRAATRLRPTPDLAHRAGLVEVMARSLAYRVLNKSSPEDE